MNLKILFFFSLLSYTASYGQYKQMLHKPYKDKVEGLAHLYKTISESHANPEEVIAYTAKMKQWALNNHDKELALEADLIKAYYYYCESKSGDRAVIHPKIADVIQKFVAIAQKAKTKNLLNIEERAVYGIALTYWWNRNYVKAFEWLLRSDNILEKMAPGNFPYMAEHLNFIGRCYYYFKDYAKAIAYYKKAGKIKKTDFNAKAVLEAQNTLGLCYQKLGQLKLAKHYFSKVIEDTSQFQDPVWKGIASGNLGYTYYMQGKYEKAIPLFKMDIENALKIKDYGLAAGSSIPLADIYLKRHKFREAKQKIEKAKWYIQKSKQTDRLRKLYPVMAKWYAVNNKPDSSMAYIDSAMVAIKKYNEKYSSLKLLQTRQKVKAQTQEFKIGQLKAEGQLKLSERNFIIALLIILLTASILTYWFRNKYHLKKQQVKDLALQNTQKELKKSKTQLENLALTVRKDKYRMDKLEKEKSSKANQRLLAQLKSKNILTPDDWAQYQDLFKKVYPGFFPSLIASYTTLSQAEIRCLCLEKLQLTNTEMALVLGVSTNAIRVTKHRIRKKLGLQSQEELKTLVQKLGTKNDR